MSSPTSWSRFTFYKRLKSSSQLVFSLKDKFRLKFIGQPLLAQQSATIAVESSQILKRLGNCNFRGDWSNQTSLQEEVRVPSPTLWMVPHLKRCLTLCSPCQNCEVPSHLELKEVRVWHIFKSLYQVSLPPLAIFQIYFTSRHSFIICELLMPRPPWSLGLLRLSHLGIICELMMPCGCCFGEFSSLCSVSNVISINKFDQIKFPYVLRKNCAS